MKIVERFLASKTGNIAECEDGIVVNDRFAAVIDGATDKSGRRYHGITGGRYAMLACADALQSLDLKADAQAGVSHLSAMLAERLPADLRVYERPAAVTAIYSESRREIWQIGDVGFWHAGLPVGGVRPYKMIDRYSAELRAAILSAALANGADQTSLAEDDIGREAILGILARQSIFSNNVAAGEWAYPVLDGRPVPIDLVTVHQVPKGVSQVVITSDGYPRILPSLQQSEDLLARLLAEDPLCIGPLRSTKGVKPGNASFDDRAYLRIRL